MGKLEMTDIFFKDACRPQMHCGQCICDQCLYRWSGRCPFGDCFDEFRAVLYPFDRVHSNEPCRKSWSDWERPGEQAHWCRGGVVYPSSACPHFVKYHGSKVRFCLSSNIQIFQDGYISCSILKAIGCEACWKQFESKLEDKGEDKESYLS